MVHTWRHKKRLAAFLMILAGLVSLFGCSTEKDAPETTAASDSVVTTNISAEAMTDDTADSFPTDPITPDPSIASEPTLPAEPTLPSEPSAEEEYDDTEWSFFERSLRKDLFLRLCDIFSDETNAAVLTEGDPEGLAERYSGSYVFFMRANKKPMYLIQEINVVDFPSMETEVPVVDFAVEFIDAMNNRYIVAISSPAYLSGFEAFFKNGNMVDMHYFFL